MRLQMTIGMSAAAILALAPAPALAHDFFLLPASFNAGAEVRVQATVGASFPAAEIVVTEDRVAEAAASEGASLRVAGAGPSALDLIFASAAPGAHVASLRLAPRDVEYAEDRIPLIMEEYEVDEAARAAVAALPAPRVLRASSQRFAKSIVCFQSCADWTRAARPAGHPLEFVADPAEPGRFVLLFQGEPLANYPIRARARFRTRASGDRRRRRRPRRRRDRGRIHAVRGSHERACQSGRTISDAAELTDGSA
jgi:hypothetical protein